jgi:pilus assembly protein Flp/PilA
MLSFLHRLSRDPQGGTAIEYGLIAALVVIAIIGALGAFADESIAMWNTVSTEVSEASA